MTRSSPSTPDRFATSDSEIIPAGGDHKVLMVDAIVYIKFIGTHAQYNGTPLFADGSMARDDAGSNSDVDLLVDAPPGASAFVLGAMLMDAQDSLGRRVDIVTRSALNPALREQVLREAQRL